MTTGFQSQGDKGRGSHHCRRARCRQDMAWKRRATRTVSVSASPDDGCAGPQVGAEGWPSIEQRDGAQGQKRQAAAVRSPTPHSEEAKY